MELHLQHEWGQLVGQNVEVRRHGEPVRRGHVDAVTKDGQVLWVRHDGAHHRQLFERFEGFEVWTESKWEAGPRAF
ncbi:hypothetical protein AB6813_01215 [bacterium RCC_150]